MCSVWHTITLVYELLVFVLGNIYVSTIQFAAQKNNNSMRKILTAIAQHKNKTNHKFNFPLCFVLSPPHCSYPKTINECTQRKIYSCREKNRIFQYKPIVIAISLSFMRMFFPLSHKLIVLNFFSFFLCLNTHFCPVICTLYALLRLHL